MPKLIDQSSGKSATPWLVLMFLFAFNFISAGGYLLLMLMAFYFIIHLRDFSFRIIEIFLFIFGVEYFLIFILWYRDATFREMCNFLVAPWMLYWIGRNMGCRSKQDDLPLRMAIVLTLGFFAYAFLCMGYSLYVSPPSAGSRVMYKFWDHSSLSVTAGGLLFSMAIGVSVGQLTSKNTVWMRLFWLAVLGVCVYYSFTWAHRTSIYILAILILYNFLAFLFTMNATAVQKLALFSCAILLISVAALCLVLDIGGCYTWLQGQWLYQRLTNDAVANSGDRFAIWGTFFEHWLLYPLGGKQFDIAASYVHNLWLDVYYLCGILPFAALVISTVIVARNVFLYQKIQRRNLDNRSANTLINCYIATFLSFMVEPVMGAYPYIFLAMLLISGCIDGSIMKTQHH